MQPHQQRVVDEKTELDKKLDGLSLFIAHSPAFEPLSIQERWRLTTQMHIMVQYSSILEARIQAFR